MTLTREQYIAFARNIVFSSVKNTIIEDVKKTFLKFLLIPAINPLFNFVLDKALNYLLDKTELQISFVYIDFRVNEQGRNFMSVVELKQQGLASEKDVIDAFRTLIKFSV